MTSVQKEGDNESLSKLVTNPLECETWLIFCCVAIPTHATSQVWMESKKNDDFLMSTWFCTISFSFNVKSMIR